MDRLLERNGAEWTTFSREKQARRIKDAIVAKEKARRATYRWNRITALPVDRKPKIETFTTSSGLLAYKLKREEGAVSVPYLSILAS